MFKTLFIHLKSLVKYLFAKPRHLKTQQVDLNIKTMKTGTVKKYFCYFTDTASHKSQSPMVMKNEEISLANVTQLRTRKQNTTTAQATQLKVPMQVDTIIVNLFAEQPTKYQQPSRDRKAQ